MNQELLEKLLEYIDAKLDAYDAGKYEDGGLSESIKVMDLKQELLAMVNNEH
jgi:hypothetical protein